ncbi:hypothetical protein HY479_01145 [Candidatus Uhrbacteria bacterium]|nr:hypothetical protein [Candidatus Uhrbacteria bacterium]
MNARHSRRTDFARHAFPQPPIAPSVYRNIAFSFLGLTVVIVAVVVWMSTVRAEIRIQATRDSIALQTTVEVAKSPEQGQLQGRVVEGTFDKIQEFMVKEQAAVSSNATTTGRVRITNRYSKAQPLIKTTRLLTPDGKLFRINATVTVPSGESIEVGAYSDKPGKGSEIPSGTTFVIPGLWIDLQKLITAEAITSFAPSSDAVKVASATDIADAQRTLEETVLEEAKKTLAAEANVPADKLGDRCHDNGGCWAAFYAIQPMEKKSNVTAGQQTDSFLAQVKLKVTAVFFPRKDMDLLVTGKLKERLPEGHDLIDFDSRNVAYTLEQSDAKVEKARLSVKTEAFSRLIATSPSLSKEGLAGLSVGDATSKLKAVDGVEFVEITLRPSWARTIPKQKDKIEIQIE